MPLQARAAGRGRVRLPAARQLLRLHSSSPAASIRNTASSASPRVVELGQPVPKGGGAYRVGKPYQVAGRTYTPEENGRYRAEGLASWYGDDFHGRLTANGEVYDMEAISAAHPTLPMPSYVRVTNLASHKSLIVRVNDRGPYHANREIDVSARAAELLGFRGHGIAQGARRICRAGAARRHRRPPADGDLAAGPAGARAASWSRANRSCRTSTASPCAARRCRRSGHTISARAAASRRRELSAARNASDARMLASEALARHPVRAARRRCLARHRAAAPYGGAAARRRSARPAGDRGHVERARRRMGAAAAGGVAGRPPMRRSATTARRRSRPGAASTSVRFPCSRARSRRGLSIAHFRAPLICRHGLGKFACRSIHLGRARPRRPEHDQPCRHCIHRP